MHFVKLATFGVFADVVCRSRCGVSRLLRGVTFVSGNRRRSRVPCTRHSVSMAFACDWPKLGWAFFSGGQMRKWSCAVRRQRSAKSPQVVEVNATPTITVRHRMREARIRQWAFWTAFLFLFIYSVQVRLGVGATLWGGALGMARLPLTLSP